MQRTSLGDKCTDTNSEQNKGAVECGSRPKHERHARQFGRAGEVPEPLAQADLAELGYHHWRSAQLKKRRGAESEREQNAQNPNCDCYELTALWLG